MGKRSRRLFSACGVAVGLSLIAAAAGSASVGDDNPLATVSRFAKIDPSLFESSGLHAGFVPALLSNQSVSVVVELGGAPVAVQDARAKQRGQKLSEADKAAIRAQLKAQQDGLHGELAAAGAQVVGQMQDAYDGIQVVTTQSTLSRLAGLPGVTAIHPVQSFTPDNVNGVPFVGAPQTWQGSNVTGQGVKVGIIDTGIDYTHADFGGPGTVAAWTAAKANSTAAPDPTLVGPAAPKVKGGFDFVGDAYNAQDPRSVPKPDPNPLDCFGHGTHTAGTLAGFGVLSDGTTFTGPYNATTVTSHSWNVGPGVAPQADLFVYRVFGCAGSSNVVALAINRAVADGVDVISMSLGSPFGGTGDPTSVASQNAFDDGIAVVASAGNSGSGAYIVGSPSTANGVLSVAALDSHQTYPGATLALTSAGGSALGSITAIDANGAALPAGPHKVVVLRNADGSVSLGCSKSDYANTAGDVVVTMRGTCARVARAVFGDEAGDAAVIMINSSAGFPPFEGTITGDPDTGEQHNVTIPFLGVQGAPSTDPKTLESADGGTVTLSATTVANPSFKATASFSSGGPRNPDSAPKPDVIAPGVSVSSAGMGTGGAAVFMSGTSMACPMTAGIAALVKQAHPTWKGAQIKAAIMNTADPSLNTGYNVRRAGAGVVQAQRAVDSSVVASTSDGLDSIAFGYVPGGADYLAHKTFALTNYGASPASYNLSVAANGSQAGSSVTVSPGSVTLAAGATTEVQATLSISAAAFAALPSDDTFSIGAGGVLSVRGDIVATPAAGDDASDQTLRLPYIVVPRGLSNVTAGSLSALTNISSTPPGTPGNTLQASFPVSNTGIHSGTANLFAWSISDNRDSGSSVDVRDVGVQTIPATSLGSTAADRGLVFLINTWGQAANQSVNEFDIPISVNGSGQTDFVVVGFDIGQATAGAFSGQLGSFTINAHTGAIVDAFFADAPMNGSTIELPALASDLGLSARANGVGAVKKQGITYSVAAFNNFPGGAADFTGSASFNPFSPAVSSGSMAPLAPGASTTFTVAVDTDQEHAQPVLGWLVASVDNPNGAPQADEVPLPSR
jgi:minor extracellular serine protease Vpr